MRIVLICLVIFLGAFPALALELPEEAGFVQLAQESSSQKKPSGRVVIRGKDGKVTGVVQQPDKKPQKKKTK